MGQALLWDSHYGIATTVGQLLWDSYCGTGTTVGQALWDRHYGTGTMGQALWDNENPEEQAQDHKEE
jgi:hypothetical protein